MQDRTGGGSAIELWLAEADHPGRDTERQRKVWEEFRWEPGLDASGITVVVAADTATLSGTVPSYHEKRLALHAAQRVAGIQGVSDELVVKLSPTDERGDTELADEVTHVLEWHVLVPRGRVRARVLEGWVHLEGEVDHDWQRIAAEQAAEPLVGVRGITNRITVAPTGTAGALRDRVGEALRRLGPCAKHIHIETDQGTVILRGQVRCLAERSDVERAVRAVPGVAGVRCDLKIAR